MNNSNQSLQRKTLIECPTWEPELHPLYLPSSSAMQGYAVYCRASTLTRLLGQTGFKPAYWNSVQIVSHQRLCRLFQASIDTGYLPHDWRSANITPIYKKGDRSDPSNYRPVSLTSIPSKILEHVIYRHLMTHLEANAILSGAQHGFRKGRSCETQLLLLLENLTKTLDNRRQVDLILTDFSKAFDKVPHQRLLLKLKNFGVQVPILDCMAHMLCNQANPTSSSCRELNRKKSLLNQVCLKELFSALFYSSYSLMTSTKMCRLSCIYSLMTVFYTGKL